MAVKSRASAREAVSSRWATRAELSSSRVRKSQNDHVGKTNQISNGSPNNSPNSSNSSPVAVESETDNIIHATWRQIQHSLGSTLLQQLDREKSRANEDRGGDSNRNSVNASSEEQAREICTPKHKKKQTSHPSQTNKNNVYKHNAKRNSSQKKSKTPNTYNGTGTGSNTVSMSRIPPTSKEQKSINKAKNAEMLANTLTQMRVTTALQTQLESITSHQDDDDGNNHKTYNYLRDIVSILPAGFDESSALIHSIQNRKRAFFLLDFGQVIKSHAKFLSYTCGFGDQIPVENAPSSSSTATAQDSHNYGQGMNLHLPPTHRLKRTVAGVNSIGRRQRRKGLYIQPQFSVTKNPNIELLKLLVRLGVDLRCNSSDDIMTASQAIQEERRNRNQDENQNTKEEKVAMMEEEEYYGDQGMVLVDDASKTRKPNGYFRRLLQTRPGHEDLEVAVDDVDEVKRISNTVRQLAMRYPNRNSIDKSGVGGKKSCRFMLRLPPMDEKSTQYNDNGLWEGLIFNVHAAAKEEGGELFGVSVDLSHWSQLLSRSTAELKNGSKHAEEKGTTNASQMLYKICTKLRLFRLLLLSVGQYHIRIDLTGLPTLSRKNCDMLTSTLSNVVSCNISSDDFKEFYMSSSTSRQDSQTKNLDEKLEEIVKLANDPATCSLFYTADVSTYLVARAGALCARIIGSKVTSGERKQVQQPQEHQQEQQIQPRLEFSTPSTSKGNQFDTTEEFLTHYFIDDGCYGSLGSSCVNNCNDSLQSKQHIPVHLYGNGSIPKSKSHLSIRSSFSKSNVPVATTISTTHGPCTVWGPTCDGLDKVCESVQLPKDLEANRDWLVFSNLGCGGFGGGLGLGTAFNGFDPPDVEYCVLGYFSSGLDEDDSQSTHSK